MRFDFLTGAAHGKMSPWLSERQARCREPRLLFTLTTFSPSGAGTRAGNKEKILGNIVLTPNLTLDPNTFYQIHLTVSNYSSDNTSVLDFRVTGSTVSR